jgi:hypothetical protein
MISIWSGKELAPVLKNSLSQIETQFFFSWDLRKHQNEFTA